MLGQAVGTRSAGLPVTVRPPVEGRQPQPDAFETARQRRVAAGSGPVHCPAPVTEALRAGVPLKDVADLMGHASVTTTEIYLHRDVTELAGSQDRIPELAPTDEVRDLAC
jgi:integrase